MHAVNVPGHILSGHEPQNEWAAGSDHVAADSSTL